MSYSSHEIGCLLKMNTVHITSSSETKLCIEITLPMLTDPLPITIHIRNKNEMDVVLNLIKNIQEL